ncbi:hypothetical protein M514_20757 [Trichuris suis]|uniref:Uncharacterized protein n=1 Tax=Trichuris suis TaxID=68888 RepID=A0A085NCE1_9BILA|nr:hypothetical protein M514_20757 [Trichuris suis]
MDEEQQLCVEKSWSGLQNAHQNFWGANSRESADMIWLNSHCFMGYVKPNPTGQYGFICKLNKAKRDRQQTL